MAGHGADPEPAPTSVTVVFSSSGGAGYGRHAAPPSAYGPADVHRLLPVPPTGPREAERADPADAPAEEIDRAAEAEAEADAGTRSSGETSTKVAGFWARLLPGAA